MIGEVLQVISELATDGMTMLVVTHEMGFCPERRRPDRLVDEGRIVEESDPEAFLLHPQSERARSFLSAVARHGVKQERSLSRCKGRFRSSAWFETADDQVTGILILKRAAEKSTANKLCFSCHKEAEMNKRELAHYSFS